jgi:hypothetical protein
MRLSVSEVERREYLEARWERRWVTVMVCGVSLLLVFLCVAG